MWSLWFQKRWKNIFKPLVSLQLLNDGDINIEDFDVEDLEDDDDDDVEEELDPDYDAEDLEDEEEEEDIDEGAFLGECEFAEAQASLNY